MPSSSLRLLMLHSKLESLKDSRSGGDMLYETKHSMLPLSTHSNINSVHDDELLLPSTPRKALGFVPKIRSLTGAISNPLTVSVATMVLLGGVLLASSLINKPTANTVQLARASTLSSSSSVATNSEDLLGLKNQYLKISEEREYGEVLFKTLTLDKPINFLVDSGTIALDSSSGFVHAGYSVLPGVRGQSLFVSQSAAIKKQLDTIIPGTKVTIAVGDAKKPSSRYNYIFIANNSYTKGDPALLTATQKSILNLVVITDEKTVQSYQFRLIGVE